MMKAMRAFIQGAVYVLLGALTVALVLGALGGVLYGFGAVVWYGTHALGGDASMWTLTKTPGNIEIALGFQFCILLVGAMASWLGLQLAQVGNWTLQLFKP